MNRAALGKIVPLLVLLIAVALLVAPSTDAGSPFAGFAGFGGFGGGMLGGAAGLGGGIIVFGGFGAEGGSGTAQVPNASSLVLTVLGMGVAAWGVWRNRR